MARDRSGPGQGDVNIGQSIISGDQVVAGPIVAGRDMAVHGHRPSTLPPETTSFATRTAETARLIRVLTEQDSQTTQVVVITGMAGLGKTALAVHVSHRVAPHYSDGCLFASMSPQHVALRAPDEVLGDFLRSLGVPAEAVPASTTERVALYRSLLADRQMLVILDGVDGEAHVQPLIPPPPSAAIITSRRRLPSIKGSTHLELGPLTAAESYQVLREASGRDRGTAEDDEALNRIAELCAGIPLALQVVAGLLRSRPTVSAASIETELSRAADHPLLFRTGDLSVRAAFDLSHQRLSPDVAWAFRVLAWMPVPTFTVDAVAAFLNVAVEHAGPILDALSDERLLSRVGRRFAFHDQLRKYAQDGPRTDSSSEVLAATERLRSWYLNKAKSATRALGSVADLRAGALVDAKDWLEDEKESLFSIATDAVYEGRSDLVWQLADALFPYYQLTGQWADCQALQELALTAARQCGNQDASARILSNLGVSLREQYRSQEAIACLEESVATARTIDAQETLAVALMNLGRVNQALGALAQAEACLNSAREVAEQLGQSSLVRQVLAALGAVYRDEGRVDEALEAYDNSLRLCRAAYDRQGEAAILINLARLHENRGSLEEALDCSRAGLLIAQEMLDRVSEGRALRGIGAVLALQGARREALAELQRSIQVAEQVNDTHTVYLAARDLAALAECSGERAEAYRSYWKSRAAANTLGDRRAEATVVTELAALSEAEGDYEGAAQYWRDAVDMSREVADHPSVAMAMARLARCLTRLGRAAEAIQAYEESAAIARDLHDSDQELTALAGLLELLRDRQLNDDAAAIMARIEALATVSTTVMR